MHIEFGTGSKTLIILNADRSDDLDATFTRIVDSYRLMRQMQHPTVVFAHNRCHLVFTSTNAHHTGLTIFVSNRPCGIYTDCSAYHKRLAHECFRLTALPIYQSECPLRDIEIGLGGLEAKTQGYVMLRDTVLGLTNVV